MKEAVPAVDIEDIAGFDVAVFCRGSDLPQRRPGADIAPAGSQGNDHGVGRLLHHRVINGVRGTGGKGLRIEACEIEIRDTPLPGLLTGVQHLRRMLAQLGQVSRCLEHEHAAVPVVIARSEVLFSRRRIRLLDKFCDLVKRWLRVPRPGPLVPMDSFACANVSIARLRGRRHDAEGQQGPRLHSAGTGHDDPAELIGIANHVVGREHQ